MIVEKGETKQRPEYHQKIIDNEPTPSFNKDEVLEITEGTTKAWKSIFQMQLN